MPAGAAIPLVECSRAGFGDGLRNAAHLLIQANVFLPLIAVCFTLGNCVMLGIRPDAGLLLLQFSATYLVYYADRALPSARDDEGEARRGNVWVCAAMAPASGIAFMTLDPPAQGIVSILGILGIGYVLPLLPGRRRLKQGRWGKAGVIAGGWAASGVLLPAVVSGGVGAAPVCFLLLYRLLYLLPNVLLSDWPDRHGDARAGLRTFASTLPPASLVVAARLALLLAAVSAVCAYGAELMPGWILLDAGGLCLLWPWIRHPMPDEKRLYQVWFDGMVGWPVLVACMAGIA